jgi:ABC-2 type transport system permease protein
MNTGRVSALVVKELRKLIREPATLFMLLLFPVILTAAFGASFGAIGSGSGASNYAIAVVNNEQTPSAWSKEFITQLTATTVLIPKPYSDLAAAQTDLQQGRISGLIILPGDFGASIDSFKVDPSNPSAWKTTTIQLSVDKGNMIVTATVPPLVQQALTTSIYGKEALSAPQPVRIGSPTLIQSEKLTQFDYMVPGLFSYAAIFISMMVAQTFTTEREQGILRRISVTPTTTGDIFASHIVSNMIIGVLQVAGVLTVARLIGFKPLGGVLELAVALLAVLLLVLCNIGFGLIVATIAKSSGAATGLSFLMILPQMFLGSFVPAPRELSSLVPTWYVSDALSSLFLRGASVYSPQVVTDITVVGVYAAVVIAIGVVLYNRYGYR